MVMSNQNNVRVKNARQPVKRKYILHVKAWLNWETFASATMFPSFRVKLSVSLYITSLDVE